MNWTETDNSLNRTFEFPSFAGAISWMVKASFEIEKLDHHPEWTNVYNQVKVTLRTHSAGNKVTDSDRRLAQILDQLYDQGSLNG